MIRQRDEYSDNQYPRRLEPHPNGQDSKRMPNIIF